MSYNSKLTFARLSLMGHEFDVEIGYTITDWGSPALIDYNNGGDPGWGPEWDIDYILLKEDREWEEGPEFEATGKFLVSLMANRKIEEAIIDDIGQSDVGDWNDY